MNYVDEAPIVVKIRLTTIQSVFPNWVIMTVLRVNYNKKFASWLFLIDILSFRSTPLFRISFVQYWTDIRGLCSSAACLFAHSESMLILQWRYALLHISKYNIKLKVNLYFQTSPGHHPKPLIKNAIIRLIEEHDLTVEFDIDF